MRKLKSITKKGNKKAGYFLTLGQICKLVRQFQADCFDGFVSNDKSYLKNYLKNL